MKKFLKKYFGNADFYRMVLVIALPVMIQNGITNSVNLLDNLMVGSLGTEQMSGVAIVNQLMMVYNICIFGILSGASLFGTQFYGRGDYKGVRDSFRFKMITSVAGTLIWMGVFAFFGEFLISLYLHDDGTADLLLTRAAGREYLLIMLIGLIPCAIAQSYANTLRETGQTLVPMIGASVAVLTNLVLNFLLIWDYPGAPRLGVAGAAIATVISRYVEMLINMLWTHLHAKKVHFIEGAYRSLKVPKALVKQIIIRGTPLLVNETLWAGSMAALNQCYSQRGVTAVAAFNISSTFGNLFNVVFIALGSSIGIVVGQLLGAGKNEEAVDTNRKMTVFSVLVCVIIGAVMYLVAPHCPKLYNTSDEVRHLAGQIIRINAMFMPMFAFYHAAYFTLRAGGKTVITFLFDSCYLLVIDLPFANLLCYLTNLPVLSIFLMVQCIEIFKGVIGFILVKKRVWVNNLTVKMSEKEETA